MINRTIVVSEDSRYLTQRVIEVLDDYGSIEGAVEQAQQSAAAAAQASLDAQGAAESVQQPPFTPFASRDDFLSTPINVDIVSVRARVGDETLGWLADPSGPIISTDGKRYRPDGPPRPQHFGAVGDGVADDSDALDAWSIYFDSLRMDAPQVLRGPAGRYRLTRPLKFIRPASSGYRSTIDLSCMELICDFNRSDYPAFIELGDRSNPAVYQAQYDLVGRILLRRGPNCTYAPVGIEAWGMAQSQMAQIDTSSWNNSLLVTHGAQNVTFKDLIFYSGGWCFGFKDAVGAGMQVTWGAGGVLTIVEGSMQFDSSWVGKTISLHTSESAYHVRITAVNSATEAVTEQLNPVSGSPSYTTQRIVRTGCCAVTTSAGSPVVTLDGDDPVGSHLIGLLVAIPRAGADGKILIAKVIGADSGARTLTLDRNAAVTLNPAANPLSDTTEIATPVVATLSDTDIGVYANGVSQVRFYNVQFETFRGLPMLFDDAELVDFFGCKFHGVQTGYAWNIHAIGAIWGNRLGGKFLGECDARYYGQFRFRFASQTQSFTFVHLAGRMATYERMLHCAPMLANFEAAVVAFDTVSMLGCLEGAEFSSMVTDENVTFAGYNPPSTFIKPDRDDVKHYCGPMHRFERTSSFSLGNAKLTFDGTTLRAATALTVEGQSATLTIKDSDNSGFTGIEWRNNGNALRAHLRVTTSSGRMDHIIGSTTQLSVDGTGIGFFGAAPVARPAGVPVTAEGIHAALVSLGLISA
ncbi:hypothetical protein NM680_13025 [Paracoccus sp. PS-1]|uniref:hypothetical protein n=1 Tax=Paracoccus sp. PS1 TaxID=2963938 RepID=UPI0027E3EDE2|nr:hypothetical protein [Paracoccus sp. PS1]MDQ7262715.1 hypothetical protein [Paracoccus sp. PS1]